MPSPTLEGWTQDRLCQEVMAMFLFKYGRKIDFGYVANEWHVHARLFDPTCVERC